MYRFVAALVFPAAATIFDPCGSEGIAIQKLWPARSICDSVPEIGFCAAHVPAPAPLPGSP